MATTEKISSEDKTPEVSKPWFRRRAVQAAGTLAAALSLIGVGVAIGGSGEKAPAPTEPGAPAPAVPGEEAPTAQPEAEAPDLNIDWGELFLRKPDPLEADVATMNEDQLQYHYNQTLAWQVNQLMRAAVAVYEAGGDPYSDIPEEYVKTVATDGDVDALGAVYSLARQVFEGTPQGYRVVATYPGEAPNGLQDITAEEVSIVTRDPNGTVQTELETLVEYLPVGGDGSQSVYEVYGATFDTAVLGQDENGSMVFTQP
jgi:hypothetical protein